MILIISLFQYYRNIQILYIKNLNDRVSENDLMSVFGRYCVDDGKGVNIKLMKTGRMRGQAFIGFQSEFNDVIIDQ